VVEAAGHCRVISRYGVGVDNVDVDAATRAGILVTYVPDYCLDEVADHTLALILAASRNLLRATLDVRSGEWTIPKAGIRRLQGRRLALIGVGRIGLRVAQRALAFGLDVVGYDPVASEPGVRRAATLEEALADADIVSLHAPLTPENHHLIGEETIALMRRAPLVVNTSRGGLVDLDAAGQALADGRLSGLALDVTEVEPLPSDHPLRTDPRALITPHMAFYSAEALDELQRRAADEVVRALTGVSPRCPVNPEVLS
jgi:D-3-phosphoglycerate dehydrogenase